MRIDVPVKFEGTIEVEVPVDTLAKDQVHKLARAFALARILATTENQDGPEEVACEDFATEVGIEDGHAGELWDQCEVFGVSGTWS